MGSVVRGSTRMTTHPLWEFCTTNHNPLVKTKLKNMALPEKFYYDNKIVKQFLLTTALWGVVGMLAGLWAALQLAFGPALNFSTAEVTFGRLRPLPPMQQSSLPLWAMVSSWVFIIHSAPAQGQDVFWCIIPGSFFGVAINYCFSSANHSAGLHHF